MATGRVPTTANSPLTAKGDLFGYSTTQARVPVGNDGETIVADSAATTGLRYQGTYAAGKNLIINGGMDVWQRGTSFTASNAYTADRWYASIDTGAGTISQQTTSLPAGFRYSIRSQRTAGNTSSAAVGIAQALETSTSIPAQGATIRLSYYAKAGANWSSSVVSVRINSGTGTDQAVASMFGGWTGYAETAPDQAITTTWTRYTATYTVPSGATQLGVRFFMSGSGTAGANDWFEVTGVQLEIASVATAFTRAGGTIQGELAACQRYYTKSYAIGTAPGASTNDGFIFSAANNVATNSGYLGAQVIYPVRMRTSPTVTTYDAAYTVSKISRVTPGGTDQNGITPVATLANDAAILILSVSGNAHSGVAFHYTASAEL